MPPVTITALNIYPVKSMQGITLRQAQLTPLGLLHDRRWMVVREDGRFVTQREVHDLACIRTRLDGDAVTISREGAGAVTLPARPEGTRLHTRVWKDECDVISAGDEVSSWLTNALESPRRLHLVAMAPGFERPMSAAGKLGDGHRTVFADAAPLLVASESSLEALNQTLVSRSLAPVPMNRFRPNVVLEGLSAFDEHRIRTLANASVTLTLRFRCERCVVTTIDQETAERDPDMQPFRTLAGINPMPDNPRAPVFGENATVETGAGATLSVGDRLEPAWRQAS